jgi:hypothetical protein
MTLFGNILGIEEDYEVIKELATEETDKKSSAGSPKSAPVGEHMERVNKADLRDDYLGDPIVFNSVNKNTQTISGAGYEIRCDGPDSKNVLEFFNKFLYVTLGNNGNDETFEEMVDGHFTKAQIYGDNYIERIYNEKETKIVDLVSLNPERMDYARNANGNILLNSKGNPIGYTQQLPYSIDISGKGDTPPEDVKIEGNMIFIKAERIAHFQLYPIGDGYESYGTVEPAHDDIIYKKNIEKANANYIVQRGMNPIIDYVGSSERFPTPKMINHATSKLSQMNYKRYFAFPYWHRVEALEFKQSDVVNDSLKNFRENISASLGIPLALGTGVGEATNRSTLVTQQKFLELTLNDFVKRTVSFFNRRIFKPIASLEGFKSTPYLVWGDLGAENKDAKAKRLVDYANSKIGILPPEFALKYVIKSEELEVPEEELKEYLKNKKQNSQKINPKDKNQQNIENKSEEKNSRKKQKI